MSNPNTIRRKYTEQLLHHLERTGEAKLLEVIVRVKDPATLTRAETMAGRPPHEVAEQERQHTRDLLGNMVDFVRRLERQGKPITLLDTSWLTHSILARATPEMVHRLAEPEEVDLVDLNTELGANFT